MANIKSAKKRVLVAERNHAKNVAFKTSIKTILKNEHWHCNKFVIFVSIYKIKFDIKIESTMNWNNNVKNYCTKI